MFTALREAGRDGDLTIPAVSSAAGAPEPPSTTTSSVSRRRPGSPCGRASSICWPRTPPREFGKYDSTSGPDGVPDLWGLTNGAGDSGRAISNGIWLRQRKAGETGLYLGLQADDNEGVDAAYAAALQAGGEDDGAPAMRTYFADGYYAANVVDFDGNRLEFVHKSWDPKRPA